MNRRHSFLAATPGSVVRPRRSRRAGVSPAPHALPKLWRWLVVAMALALIPLVARAVPTGLNSMPTATVLGLGEARLDYEFGGSGKLYASSDSTVYGTEAGLLLGFELGADQVSDRGAVYNIKWRLIRGGILFPSIAVGAQNVSADEKTQYYAVASKSLGPIAVHGGVLRDVENDDDLVMVGADADLGPISLRVDRINGGLLDRTSASVGFTVRGLTIRGTTYDFENAPDERTVSVSYRYSAL